MNDELIGVEAMMASDGFIDFYKVLGVTRTAASEEILENANALYQEAQTNRDHRVAARRREYQLLLELLPQARTVLTDKARRRRYDAYCTAVEMQLPRMPYSDFFNDLMREKEAIDARSDILTVRDLSRLRSIAPENLSNGSAAEPKAQPVVTTPAEPEAVAAPVATSPVVTAPVEEVISAPATPATTPTPAKSAPEPTASGASHFFPVQSLIGGGIILAGMLASLPTLAGIPMVLAAPLALISAGVTAFVFSMTAEPLEV